MRIGIIGSGNVGSALGRAWAAQGHEIRYGVRDPGAPKVTQLLAQIGAGASAASVAEAAAFGEAVLLATSWSGAQDAIRAAGDLSGKVLLDCTNPLKPDLAGLELGTTTSAGEQVAAWAPGARVVKIFNNTGAANMTNPAYDGVPVTMFLCGDDAAAKATAAGLARGIGFDPVDAGPLTQARLLEPLALLWITLAYREGMGPGIAFKLLRRGQ